MEHTMHPGATAWLQTQLSSSALRKGLNSNSNSSQCPFSIIVGIGSWKRAVSTCVCDSNIKAAEKNRRQIKVKLVSPVSNASREDNGGKEDS